MIGKRTEIHWQLCDRDRIMRQWYIMIKNGHSNHNHRLKLTIKKIKSNLKFGDIYWEWLLFLTISKKKSYPDHYFWIFTFKNNNNNNCLLIFFLISNIFFLNYLYNIYIESAVVSGQRIYQWCNLHRAIFTLTSVFNIYV